MNWLALIPILLAFAVRLVPGPRIVDDAYITFRYAHNLAAGHGLIYNPGEWVLGTTTPLYTVLLAGLSHLLSTDDLPHLAWALNAACDAAGTALVFWLGTRLSGRRVVGLGAALWWAIAPFSVTFAIGGLETSLIITLLLAAFALHLAGKADWTAFVLGLAVLTRPDALIAALLLLGALGLRWLWTSLSPRAGREAFPYRPAAIFVATVVPWLVTATLVYGSPLPNSLAAKTVAYRMPPEAALVRWLQHLGTPFHEHLVLGGRWVLVGLLLYGTLWAIGWLASTRQHGWLRAGPLFLYPVVYAVVYAAANPLIFRWYLSPPIPFYYLGILSGVAALGALLPDRPWRLAGQPGPSRATVIIAAAACLALASLGNAWTRQPPGPPARPAPRMAWIELETLYQQVALDIREELAASGGRLAAGDIGTLGWYTGAPILDLVGLVTPQATGYYPLLADAYVINYAVSADLVMAEAPEMIVILEVYGRKTLATDGRFQASYRLWRDYPTDIYGSTAMLVYQRIR